MPQTRSQKRKADLDTQAGTGCKLYGEPGKEVSEATMKFALLEAGVAVGVLDGMSSQDLQSLYQSRIKKSKISKTNSGLQKTHKKITYCTWDSRARRSAKTPNSASQYYKMSKEELMSLLEPFDLDKGCLNNTALAKLCVLYHSEISAFKHQNSNQQPTSWSVRSPVETEDVAIDHDNPRKSKHLLASSRPDSSSPTPNTSQGKEALSNQQLDLNTVEGSSSRTDWSEGHGQLNDDSGSQDAANRKSPQNSLTKATPECNDRSPNQSPNSSTHRPSNSLGMTPSSSDLDTFEILMNKDESYIENTRNNQDQSDTDDEPFRQQDSTPSSRSISTQHSQRKHVKKTLARPKRKVRRPHSPRHKIDHKKGKQRARFDFSPSGPSSIIPNQPDHTPDSSPHRITHYNKGKQPQRNNRSSSRSSYITPDQTGHSPDTSPRRTTWFNKGKQPATTNPSASQSTSYISPHPTVCGMSRSGRKDAPDNHRHTNDQDSPEAQSAPERLTNRHPDPLDTNSTRMPASIENRLLDLESKVTFLESNAGDRDVDIEALNTELHGVRQRLEITLRDVRISLRNTRRNQGRQTNEQGQQHENEENNLGDAGEAIPQAKKAVLRGLIRFHLKVLYGQRKSVKTMPEGASPAQRSSWLRKSMRQMLTMDLEEVDAELNEPDSNDPQFPYAGGPGSESTTPQVIKIIWVMMCGVRMVSYRLNFDESIHSKENTFLLEFATASFIKLVECGEYKGITPGDIRPEIIFNLMKQHAKDRLRRIWREQHKWTPERRKARDKKQLRVSRARTLKDDRLAVVGSKESLWPLDPWVEGCCSDDETDDEATAALNSKVCRIRRFEWRSIKMNYILDKIDEYRDKKARSSPGSTPGGNPYRRRVRSENNPLNPSAPPARLPLDCYDRDWYDALEQDAKDELEALPPVGLTHYTRLMKKLCCSG